MRESGVSTGFELSNQGAKSVNMVSSFDPLPAVAFLVFAILIAVVMIVIVHVRQLPAQVARKWNNPRASAINPASWIGTATGGLLSPLALIWAFMTPTARPALGQREGQQSTAADGVHTASKEIKS